MGALSSWAMLAVTHHLIVQEAYRRSILLDYHKLYHPTINYSFFYSRKSVNDPSKRSWYDNYELLGDDIVIFDSEVATHYLEIMAELGVAINLSKSVVSKNETFEFAKVTGHFGIDISALP